MLTQRTGLPVILMTGMSNPDPRRIGESGALLLLHKPFPREAVVDALALALAHSRRDGGAGQAIIAVR
jgi:FixJ family two-component response regulator